MMTSRKILPLIALVLSACTSVTQVSITPDQVQSLAGLPPTEEREFISPDHEEPLMARGDDEVQLRVRPGKRDAIAEMPWVQLCQLRWEPLWPTGVISDGVLRVPGSDLVGAEVRISRPNAGNTTALVVVIVLGAVVLGLAIAGFVALERVGPAQATN
jgi:hypothetical protein